MGFATLLTLFAFCVRPSVADKAWAEWYWSTFDPSTGVWQRPLTELAIAAAPASSRLARRTATLGSAPARRVQRPRPRLTGPTILSSLATCGGLQLGLRWLRRLQVCHAGACLHVAIASLRAVTLRRFHVQRFYAVLDVADMNKYDGGEAGEASPADVPFSHNIGVGKLPFSNASRHLHNIQAGVLRGTCLWLDFPFPAFPENMGHWAEALAPVYSALADGGWRRRAPDGDGRLQAVIFPNLRREQVEVRLGGTRCAARCATPHDPSMRCGDT